MNVKILNYFYYNNYDKENEKYNAPVLCLCCRDKDWNFHLAQVCDKENLAPYFGILLDEAHKVDNHSLKGLVNYRKGPNSLYGEKTLQLFATFPYEVRKLRDEFDQTFVADVKWEKMAMSKIIAILGLQGPYIDIPNDYAYRFLKLDDIKTVDKKDFFYVKQRICYWDIETSTKDLKQNTGWKDYQEAPIVSITTYDNYTNKYTQFVWHPKFEKNIEYEFKNYRINEKHLIDYIKRYEFTNERDMLKELFDYLNKYKFDRRLGYFSEGGFRKQSFSGTSSRKWVDGFDMPMLYKRAEYLGLLGYMQKISPSPIKKQGDRYDAVYMRRGGKADVVVKGMSGIDFVFTREVLQFDQKYDDFRGHKLNDWMLYFLGYGKLEKEQYQVWQYWVQQDLEEIDDSERRDQQFINGLYRVPQRGIEYMLDYNLIDVKGVYALDEKFKVTDSQFGRAEVSISPFEDGIFGSKLHDHAKLTLYQNDYAFDTKYQKFHREEINGKDQVGKNFTLTLKDLEDKAKASGKDVNFKTLKDIGKIGGYVSLPLGRGRYNWIAVIDFSKFYPNAIKSCNAGIETAIDIVRELKDSVYGWVVDKEKGRKLVDIPREDLIETPVCYFRKDIKSLNSKVFDMWLKIRKEAQDELKQYMDIYKTTKTDKYKLLWTDQFNKKNFTNSAFGVFGLPIDRMYSRLIFNSCTCSCQDIIKFCLNTLRQYEIRVIGGDTDSCFIQLQADNLYDSIAEGESVCDLLNEKIDKYLDEVYNIQENTIHIGLETVSDKFYVDTMKHYIKRNLYVDGTILEEPELEIKGMDLKKRATSQLAADVQRKLIDIIFNEDEPYPKIVDYICDVNKDLENCNWDYVCKHGALNKPLDKYAPGHQSARAARNSQKYLGKQYLPGANPFLGVFKTTPDQLNGKFINGHQEFVMSFDREDVKELVEAGFDLNWDRIRETELFKKTEHLLEVFGTDFYSVIESTEMGDFMDL